MNMSRKTKISCDVTREADNMLKGYCKQHERSKGYIIEKMIRKFCVPSDEQTVNAKAPTSSRKKVSYPNNLDEQFVLLWETKGKKGSRQKAYDIYRKMSAGNTSEVLESFTLILIDDINKKKHEPGYPERLLTSYLNGKFWE